MASGSVVLPPPYKGQNNQFPLAVIQSPYCESLHNFLPEGSSLKIRNGNTKFASIASTANVLNLAAYGTTALFAVYDTGGQMRWLDVTAGGAGVIVFSPAGATGDDEIHTLYFNGYLFYFGESSLAAGGACGPVQYTGSVWERNAAAASPYVWPASFNPFGGCVHKSRAYFIGRNSAAFGYSGIDSIGGTVTKKDLSGFLQTKANLYIIRSISMSENVTQENVAAFIFSNGEVLAYGGSYPDSDTWSLIARFRISNPLYQNSFCDAKGDSFIFTETEVLSLRNLFMGGYSKERSEGIGAAIKNRYAQIIAGIRIVDPNYLKFVKGIYDERNDRMIISFPLWVDPATGTASGGRNLLLIYDFTVDAWYESYQFADINFVNSGCYFNQNSYLLLSAQAGAGYVFQLETKSGFVDDQAASTGTVGFDYLLKSAPLPIQKFGVNSIQGLEIIMRSDLYTGTSIKFIADLGRQETSAQFMVDQGSSIAKPMYNVGITASFTQVEIEGTTISAADDGLELYAFNVWYDSGDKGSR